MVHSELDKPTENKVYKRVCVCTCVQSSESRVGVFVCMNMGSPAIYANLYTSIKYYDFYVPLSLVSLNLMRVP